MIAPPPLWHRPANHARIAFIIYRPPQGPAGIQKSPGPPAFPGRQPPAPGPGQKAPLSGPVRAPRPAPPCPGQGSPPAGAPGSLSGPSPQPGPGPAHMSARCPVTAAPPAGPQPDPARAILQRTIFGPPDPYISKNEYSRWRAFRWGPLHRQPPGLPAAGGPSKARQSASKTAKITTQFCHYPINSYRKNS
jgi:hypothetical protein